MAHSSGVLERCHRLRDITDNPRIPCIIDAHDCAKSSGWTVDLTFGHGQESRPAVSMA